MKETFYSFDLPCSLASLSDFHNSDPGPVLASLRQRRPQLIAIPGDFIKSEQAADGGSVLAGQPEILTLFEECVSVAPTFVSLGNHEWPLTAADYECIRRSGVILLDNSFQKLTISGIKLVIGGLTSAYVTECRRVGLLPPEEQAAYKRSIGRRKHGLGRPQPAPETAWLSSYLSEEGYHLLLNHHPEYTSFLPGQPELVLSGHAHGGQWNYYSFRKRRPCGVWAPGQGLFPEYTSGFYGNMLVSRGLANTTVIPRFFNPEEIVYIYPENK